MYLLGFSLDNLSLMGTDARGGIRHRRCDRDAGEHLPPHRRRHAADGGRLKGAGEIGFTIVSISFSLVAVFIPLLLMGGIVGRLFREFAMTSPARCWSPPSSA